MQDEVNRENSEQNKVDGMKKEADFTKMMHLKDRLFRNEDTDRARLTADEKQVLNVDSPKRREMKLCR